MGFIESWKKGWSFIKAAFAMARDNKRLLLPSLYQVLLGIAYFATWIVALVAIDPHWSDGMWAAVSAVATFGSFLIFYFFCGITVNMVDVHLKGGAPSIGEGARDAGKNFVAIVFLALVSTVIEMFARAARNNDSIVGKIIAGIVEAIWTTLSFLLLPAIIIEDAGFGQAMKRVRELHKGNLLLIGIGEVGVRGITGLIGFVWILLTFGLAYLLGGAIDGTAGLVIAVAIASSALVVYIAFSTFIRMAYYTCLYLWALDVEAKGETAEPPLPLAVALGRHSSYKRAA